MTLVELCLMAMSWLWIMTWLLVLVKVDFKLIDTLPWSLEHVINMCEHLQETCLVLAWKGNSWFVYITIHWVMWKYIGRLSCIKVKVKERNWVRICFAIFGNSNSKRMSYLQTRSLLNPNLSKIMWICAIFMDMYLKDITNSV